MLKLLMLINTIYLLSIIDGFTVRSSLLDHRSDSFVLYGNLRTCEKLKRAHSPRRALLRALTTQVLRHGRIITTLNKARQTKPKVERIIKYSKKDNTRHARLLINRYLYDRQLTENILSMAPIRFKERQGGYCRIKRLSQCNQGIFAEQRYLDHCEVCHSLCNNIYR